MFQQYSKKPIYKLKFFVPNKEEMPTTVPPEVTGVKIFKDPQKAERKHVMKQFLEPSDTTFSQIRKRLSAMKLNVEYKRNAEAFRPNAEAFRPPPVFQERKPPRRISSINSKDTDDRYQNELFKPNHLLYDNHARKDRLNSRASFLSDDNEYRNARKNLNLYRNRASESDALSKLNENILTPRQNPELFSRQIKLNGKVDDHGRSESPKSLKSTDSTGKVHLGLIESLDLNEKLNDVERIKERYSSDQFMNSLTLYKLRGHDRCFYNDGLGSDHIPRGTRLMSPDSMLPDTRGSSRLSLESSTTVNSLLSPRLDIKFRLTHAGNKNWSQEESRPDSRIQATPKPHGAPRSNRKPLNKRKSVGFDMNHKEIVDQGTDNLISPPSRASRISSKEPKSILKKGAAQDELVPSDAIKKSHELDTKDEEFLANANYRWRLHLPKIHSPVASLRHHPSIPFRKKMYHFGEGISSEFEAVINRYGNCRQPSMIRDRSIHRDASAIKS